MRRPFPAGPATANDRAAPERCARRDAALFRWLAPAYLPACLLLGGSSSGGAVANALLQLSGLIVIGLALHHGVIARMPPAARALLVIACLSAAWLTLSLIPLPAGLWTGWNGRDGAAAGFRLAGLALPALPVSLAPNDTAAMLLAFLPPVALFLSVIQAPPRTRRITVLVLVGLTLTAIVFGVMQQVSGYRSTLYWYDITSRGGATGFFANRNHLATLCLMAMPFVAALGAAPGDRDASSNRMGHRVIAGAAFLFLVVGALVVQSLAGWLLLLPTVLASMAVYRRRPGVRRKRWLIPAAAVTVAAAILAALFSPIAPLGADSVAGELRPQERRVSMRLTAHAAAAYFPLGSGFGSFTRVYPAQEDPALATGTFVNHAHNDYLELLLEGGVAGLAMLAAFLIWWGRQSVAMWRDRGAGAALARAGSIAVAVLMAHSFVDYPIRTAAIAAVAAFACALMTVAGEIEIPLRRRRRNGGDDRRTIFFGDGADGDRLTIPPLRAAPAAAPPFRSVRQDRSS